MSKITEPEVVFCEFNHIYDKSLHDSCPYCKQNAERASQVKRQAEEAPRKEGGRFWNFLRSGRSNDSGLRLDTDDAWIEQFAAESQQTPPAAESEGLFPGVIREETIAQIAEAVAETEIQEDTASPEPRRRVIGWLVCTGGGQNYGTSAELKEGTNAVLFDSQGNVQIEDARNCTDSSVVIYRDRATGIFQIRAEAGCTVTVNERVLYGSAHLEPYSRIQVRSHSFVFFPAVGVCGFEWRQ